MNYKPYPKYKDSGVEWLGEVPEGWMVIALKHRFQIVGGSTPKSETEAYWEGDIPWATPADLSKLASLHFSNTQRKITNEELASCGTTQVPASSIILSTRAPIGSLAIAEVPMCTNQGCKSLVPSKIANSTFYAYLLSISSTELNIRGKGTTFLELSSDELGAFKLPLPPLPEQIQIASFLDRECGKLDALQAKQERLIELLKEKRQALISHAVTKGLPGVASAKTGLDPTAKLKPSGIEWLGEVPVRWRVCRVKHVAKLESGHTPSKTMPGYWENCTVPWVSLNDTKQLKEVDYIAETALQISELGMKNSSAHLLPERAVIFTRDATIGLAAITTLRPHHRRKDSGE